MGTVLTQLIALVCSSLSLNENLSRWAFAWCRASSLLIRSLLLFLLTAPTPSDASAGGWRQVFVPARPEGRLRFDCVPGGHAIHLRGHRAGPDHESARLSQPHDRWQDDRADLGQSGELKAMSGKAVNWEAMSGKRWIVSKNLWSEIDEMLNCSSNKLTIRLLWRFLHVREAPSNCHAWGYTSNSLQLFWNW